MAGKKTSKMAPSAVKTAVERVTHVKQPPRIIGTSQGGMKVINEEWLASVAPINNANYILGLGPGASTMNWIKSVAKNFAKYRVNKFEVSFVSNAATTTGGSIAMAPFYDDTDAVVWELNGGYIELLMANGAVVGPVYGQTLGKGTGPGTMTLTIDCARLHARVPWFNVGGNSFLDAGTANQINFAYVGWVCSGVTGGVVPGNIICRYEYEFIQPAWSSNSNSPPPSMKEACPKPDWWAGGQDSWEALVRYNPRLCKPLPAPKPVEEGESE